MACSLAHCRSTLTADRISFQWQRNGYLLLQKWFCSSRIFALLDTISALINSSYIELLNKYLRSWIHPILQLFINLIIAFLCIAIQSLCMCVCVHDSAWLCTLHCVPSTSVCIDWISLFLFFLCCFQLQEESSGVHWLKCSFNVRI